jgi:hypothetical protein
VLQDLLVHMIRDRDRIYGSVVTRSLRAMGTRDKPIVPASPWQIGFAERLIGSIRRECLDHIIVIGEVYPRRILKSYAHSPILEQGCADITFRRGSSTHSVPSDPGWSASPCSRLICGSTGRRPTLRSVNLRQ